MGHINGLVLVCGRRREEHEKIVSLSGVGLGCATGGEVNEVDMVNRHLGIVFLAPLLAESLVEPFIVRGNKVAPLDDLQRLLLGCGTLRKQKRRTPRAGRNTS